MSVIVLWVVVLGVEKCIVNNLIGIKLYGFFVFNEFLGSEC